MTKKPLRKWNAPIDDDKRLPVHEDFGPYGLWSYEEFGQEITAEGTVLAVLPAVRCDLEPVRWEFAVGDDGGSEEHRKGRFEEVRDVAVEGAQRVSVDDQAGIAVNARCQFDDVHSPFVMAEVLGTQPGALEEGVSFLRLS